MSCQQIINSQITLCRSRLQIQDVIEPLWCKDAHIFEYVASQHVHHHFKLPAVVTNLLIALEDLAAKLQRISQFVVGLSSSKADNYFQLIFTGKPIGSRVIVESRIALVFSVAKMGDLSSTLQIFLQYKLNGTFSRCLKM